MLKGFAPREWPKLNNLELASLLNWDLVESDAPNIENRRAIVIVAELSMPMSSE
jgi:predicted RNA methylase